MAKPGTQICETAVISDDNKCKDQAICVTGDVQSTLKRKMEPYCSVAAKNLKENLIRESLNVNAAQGNGNTNYDSGVPRQKQIHMERHLPKNDIN